MFTLRGGDRGSGHVIKILSQFITNWLSISWRLYFSFKKSVGMEDAPSR